MRKGYKDFQVTIWDTAGQERFRSISHSFYKSANAIILAYDLTSMNSFCNIHDWVDGIRNHGDEHILKFLVATKCDKESDR